ncbi:hypothetical protein HIM_09203 [Hirsutella minnesotensis 3608]|uniref:2EXR domain-containing protein n=1 Tax=Hirsutella minnesotensis 3608 TaxID=1043627 RepID=A0A0F7ZLS4_9HYPO|nr:hypothetical protein HIM_09203 [Hirsutella minnesotensis 3608]
MEGSFVLFPRLPEEIRLIIWELTWPKARIIEYTLKNKYQHRVKGSQSEPDALGEYSTSSDTKAGEYETDDILHADCECLQLSGRLSRWIKEDISSRDETVEALEHCEDPVALHVCQESRAYTLGQYKCLKHFYLDNASFYFNPQMDFLWLGHDFDSDCLRGLRRFYGHQLKGIENVVVEALGLWADGSLRRASKLLRSFQGLSVVRVILESFEFSLEEQPLPDAAEYQEAANELVARDSYVFRSCKWRIQYVDRDGAVYGEI